MHNIQNTYLCALYREKIYCRVGSKFRSKTGKIIIIKIVLCELKSSSTTFRSILAKVIYNAGYYLTKADLDTCIELATKPNRFKYYEILLVCSDYILSTSNNPIKAINSTKIVFKLKGDKANIS